MATSEEPDDPFADIGRRAREDSLGSAGEGEDAPRWQCYACGAAAVQYCDRCRARFCPRHGRGQPTAFSTRTTLICSRCVGREWRIGVVVGLVIAIPLLVFMVSSCVRSEQRHQQFLKEFDRKDR